MCQLVARNTSNHVLQEEMNTCAYAKEGPCKSSTRNTVPCLLRSVNQSKCCVAREALSIFYLFWGLKLPGLSRLSSISHVLLSLEYILDFVKKQIGPSLYTQWRTQTGARRGMAPFPSTNFFTYESVLWPPSYNRNYLIGS